MRSCCKARSRSIALNRPARSNLATKLTAKTTMYITTTTHDQCHVLSGGPINSLSPP